MGTCPGSRDHNLDFPMRSNFDSDQLKTLARDKSPVAMIVIIPTSNGLDENAWAPERGAGKSNRSILCCFWRG